MFELHQTTNSEGSLAEVWIDKKSKLCKKYYKPNGITVSGKSNEYDSMRIVTKLFNNEIYWTTKLKSDLILETYEYGKLDNNEGFYILQEYVGPDLLTYYKNETLHQLFPNIIEQVEEIFKLFQINGIYKTNNALSNMTGVNGKVKAFDFKYAEHRTSRNKNKEINSIQQWISKIDPTMEYRLMKYL